MPQLRPASRDDRPHQLAATLQRAVPVPDFEVEPSVADEAAPPLRHQWVFAVQLGRRITQHHTLLLASGVAFSSVLGLIPALVGVVSVYGLVAAPEDVESNLKPLTTALPQEAATLIVNQLRNVTEISSPQVTVGLIAGLIGVMWAISNAVNAVVMAIRVAHEIPRPHTWVRALRSQAERNRSTRHGNLHLACCCSTEPARSIRAHR